jgi:hypothetical protein
VSRQAALDGDRGRAGSGARLHDIFGSHNAVSRPSADSLENTGYNPKRVLFEVFGSPGSVATINYLDVHAQPQRVADAPLPRSQLLTTDDSNCSPTCVPRGMWIPSAVASPSTAWSRTRDPLTASMDSSPAWTSRHERTSRRGFASGASHSWTRRADRVAVGRRRGVVER